METKTKFERLGLFDAKVPRYTSYPTAPHFSDRVGSDQMQAWIKAVPAGGQISLYIHIPFCRRLCWFCACRTQGTATAAPVAAYLETLFAEIDMLARTLPPGVRLNRMHWGGGTPTLLTPDMIAGLAGKIAGVLPFTPGAEFSVEIDPNEIDGPRVDALVAAGMTRASIGVQDFDPDIQAVIGRDQSFEITAQAVERLRDAGVHSLNADILFGLPHQTPERITDSVSKLLSLGPDRVALYGYAHVPWMARRQSLIPSDALPTPAERLNLFEIARKLFTWDGYEEVGIDHFAVPSDSLAKAQAAGQLKRNFQGYTDDQNDTLIGLGASSISRFPQGYAQNNPATSRYATAVRDGVFATAKGHAFQGDDLLRAAIIERIMCDFEVSAQDFGAQADQARALMRTAAQAFDETLILQNDTLIIPPASRALTRLVARHFDDYTVEEGRHASAI
ncbi:oxygen-independent coproporphyrinogen III oxidase [uncultured Tateyamaria sp.]|uniref:oxygen-independent coproporphyrinogen III oxidase n=1 Tax=uncultured Tateyamaria sp. TaxID=455651 RepID=UPI00262A08BB|nr:oxygen-independent coproporphyrinogen III oxidase [uncultured Tateyamaria sp.]